MGPCEPGHSQGQWQARHKAAVSGCCPEGLGGGGMCGAGQVGLGRARHGFLSRFACWVWVLQAVSADHSLLTSSCMHARMQMPCRQGAKARVCPAFKITGCACPCCDARPAHQGERPTRPSSGQQPESDALHAELAWCHAVPPVCTASKAASEQ